MNKIKKILASISITFAGLISNIYTVHATPAYGIPPEPKEEKIWNIISKIGIITIPVILFIIGLFVILNKKISKKVKKIVISVLIVLSVLGYILINYIAIVLKS